MKNELKIEGFLECWVEKPNGVIIPVYKGSNSIRGELKGYLHNKMDDAALDNALDNLFTDDEIEVGGTQDGKDGIIINFYHNLDAVVKTYTTITTAVTASKVYGAKWKGEIEFTNDGEFRAAFLGFDYNDTGGSGGTGSFGVSYAFQDPTNVSIAAQDKMIFNWEVYIV